MPLDLVQVLMELEAQCHVILLLADAPGGAVGRVEVLGLQLLMGGRLVDDCWAAKAIPGIGLLLILVLRLVVMILLVREGGCLVELSLVAGLMAKKVTLESHAVAMRVVQGVGSMILDIVVCNLW